MVGVELEASRRCGADVPPVWMAGWVQAMDLESALALEREDHYKARREAAKSHARVR
jgi:hypothetical protein